MERHESRTPFAPTRALVPAPSLDQQVEIETPEQVVFSYTIAGIGSRAAAALIDYLVFFGISLICVLAIVAMGKTFGELLPKVAVPWVIAIGILAFFALFWGYFVFFEGLWDGQTPGKRQMGLRVVRDGGYAITFGASAIRNLVRLIDLQPGSCYGLGMISVIFSSTGKRLGDYAAGTMVVRERTIDAPTNAALRASGQSSTTIERWQRWREFARLLTYAQQRRLRNMSEIEVSDFVARYREVAADLARLQATQRKRAPTERIDTVFYLSRLVAGGHNLLYRERGLTLRAIWQYFTCTIPREIRRSVVPIGIAATLLFAPAVIAYTAVVRTPSIAPQFIPPEMITRAENGVARAKSHTGYIEDPELFRPIMSSAIIANNVQVTFVALAGGMIAGIGTVLALVFNGISLGGVLGLYQSKGILPLIVAFVAPHGVLELSAICIAGGGGLLLASAMLLPGPRTRREAFRENGRRAIRLIGAAILLLMVAGTFEGLVSPIPWWTLGEKLTVSALTAVLLGLYINLDRGKQEQEHATQEFTPE